MVKVPPDLFSNRDAHVKHMTKLLSCLVELGDCLQQFRRRRTVGKLPQGGMSVIEGIMGLTEHGNGQQRSSLP